MSNPLLSKDELLAILRETKQILDEYGHRLDGQTRGFTLWMAITETAMRVKLPRWWNRLVARIKDVDELDEDNLTHITQVKEVQRSLVHHAGMLLINTPESLAEAIRQLETSAD